MIVEIKYNDQFYKYNVNYNGYNNKSSRALKVVIH